VTTAPVVLEDASARKFVSAPARLKNTTTRTLGEKNSNTGSLAHILSSTYGTFLKGVVAYVDVWTAEGDEAGGTFVEMLKRCGARVLVKKPTEACTHIIYKTGRPATANFVRRLDADKRPKVVGIKWVKMCAELGTWVPEDEHLVNLDAEDIFIPKKKSMQPKPMRCLGSGAIGLGEARINVPLAARHPGVRVANPRNMYAPKVGSPLKKSYVHQDENS
jgi:hypothetical protein